MSRVIKNNDGVAVVEGTPAASLVKDVDKFFAAKPRERMAGENIAQKRTLDPRAINIRRPTPKDLEQMNNPPNVSPEDDRMFMGGSKDFNEKTGRVEPDFRDSPKRKPFERHGRPAGGNPNRNEAEDVNPRGDRKPFERHGRPAGGNPNRNKAKEKAESRRERFFQRRRSRKEAERSQREQESTQGKFITTLGR